MSKHLWKVRVIIEEATLEVAFLFTNEDVKDEVQRILKILAAQDDPRSPIKSSGLDVSELVDDAPNWFRVKIGRYGIRLVFRVLIVRNQNFLVMSRNKPLPTYEEGDKCYIEIMQAGYRKNVYGKELRERFLKYKADDT